MPGPFDRETVAGPLSQWDMETDLLVFGSGAGGLAASLYGAKAGFRVLLCEKSQQLGGTTATSGGILWIPGNRQAREAGIVDSKEEAHRYLRHELANHYRADLVDAFVESAADALEELEAGTEIAFDLSGSPDYHPDSPGGMDMGRSVIIRRFDGRKLGADFELVRPPMSRLMVLGGMMVGPDDLPAFVRPWGSFGNAARVVRRVARYAVDRLRWSRGAEISNGNALVARSLLSLRKLGAQIFTDTPLLQLIREGKQVCGAIIEREGRTIRVRALRGVVLATGGFPSDPELRERYSAEFPHDHTMGFEGNTGDGLRAAVAVGAAVDTAVASPGLWTPASLLKEPDGSVSTIIYGYLDRGRPGIIAVDPTGRRFVNESNSYHDIVMAMYERDPDAANFYFICDQDFVRRNGLGATRPWPWTFDLKHYARCGYIEMAETLGELAGRIGINPGTLEGTVQRHNDFAREGTDLDFGKGSNAYNRSWGNSRSGWPNPNLTPIKKSPFIALKIVPATLGTVVGLKTDANACVLDNEGSVIPGLFACGNDLASAMRGYYPGGGVTLGPAIVFAYRAIKHCVGTSSATTDALNKWGESNALRDHFLR